MSELESKWRRILLDWQSSGLKQCEYCRREGHVASQFSYWNKKLNRNPESQALIPREQNFVELKATKNVEGSAVSVELEFPSGLLLRVRG